jgi:glycosyltransferase involved in cell wall biosynthesis
MIVFVQPYGLQAHGGGARILRSLLADAPAPYTVVNTSPWEGPIMEDADELRLPRRPALGRLEASRLQRFIAHADRWYATHFTQRLAEACRAIGASVVHAIPHGPEFWYAYEAARQIGARYALYVHDDLPYNLPHVPYLDWAMERLGDAWRNADARFVISEPMGRAFNERYGVRPYAVITDGLTEAAPTPRARPAGRLRMYLMGSIHLSYEQNFRELFQALAAVRDQRPDLEVSMVLRGGFPFEVDTAGIPVEVRPWGSQEAVHADLEDVDVLYLPLPFDDRHASFVKYSLSTKLVTYAGSGVPIVYHGPGESAAADLLRQFEAGAMAIDAGAPGLANAIALAASDGDVLARGALDLARSRFMLDDLRSDYWGALLGLTDREELPRSTRSMTAGAV